MGPPHPPLNPFGSSSFTHTYSLLLLGLGIGVDRPHRPHPHHPTKSQSVSEKGANTHSQWWLPLSLIK